MGRRNFSRLFLRQRREPLILAALLLLLAVGLGLLAVRQPAQKTAQAPEITASPPAAAPAPAAIEPGFDVIRVTRDGKAVMAGRAVPGAKVTVRSGDQIVGETVADKRGDWVMIPETPLKPGAQVLTLQMQQGAQGPVLSRDSAVISVPLRPDGDVFVAISREGRATRVLDQGLPEAKPRGVSVAGVDLSPDGGARLSGRSEPEQRVRVYVNNQPVGETLANAQGEWELAYSGTLAAGRHILRADQIDAAGKVLLRAETSFSRAPEGRFEMGAQQVMVMQGNALWEIARRIYGSGIAYSIIFTGNRQQIRDPDKIYPGQIFDIPPAAPNTEAEPQAPTAPDRAP